MTTAVPAVSIMKYETEIEQLIHDLGWHRAQFHPRFIKLKTLIEKTKNDCEPEK